MKIVSFERQHLANLKIELAHNQDARAFLEASPAALDLLCQSAWSMEDRGEIVGCGGSVPRSDETTWWIAFTKAALEHPVAFTLCLRHHLQKCCGAGIHTAHAQDEVAERWLGALGFAPMGVEEFGMRKVVWVRR